MILPKGGTILPKGGTTLPKGGAAPPKGRTILPDAGKSIYRNDNANNTTTEIWDINCKLILTKQLNENHIDISPLTKGLCFINLTSKELA